VPSGFGSMQFSGLRPEFSSSSFTAFGFGFLPLIAINTTPSHFMPVWRQQKNRQQTQACFLLSD